MFSSYLTLLGMNLATGGPKLASMILCLNASKAVSSLAQGGIDISGSLVSQKAQNSVTLLGDRLSLVGRRTSPVCRIAPSSVVGISLLRHHDAKRSIMGISMSMLRLGIVCIRLMYRAGCLTR